MSLLRSRERRANAILALVTLSNHDAGTVEQLGLDRTCSETGRLRDDLGAAASRRSRAGPPHAGVGGNRPEHLNVVAQHVDVAGRLSTECP